VRVRLRLVEHDGQALLKQRAVDPLDVVAVQNTNIRKVFHQQNVVNLMPESLRLDIKPSFFFRVNAIDCHSRSFAIEPQ
jgi:hypothetical protein